MRKGVSGIFRCRIFHSLRRASKRRVRRCPTPQPGIAIAAAGDCHRRTRRLQSLSEGYKKGEWLTCLLLLWKQVALLVGVLSVPEQSAV